MNDQSIFHLSEEDTASRADAESKLKDFLEKNQFSDDQQDALQSLINDVYNIGRTVGWNESYGHVMEVRAEASRRAVLPFLYPDRQRRK